MTLQPYRQWWGGRAVPMGGVAAVAVHPAARGGGTASRLMRVLLAELRHAAVPLSGLYPTATGIYRPLGWEVVADLLETPLPTAALAGVRRHDPVALRSAGPDDLPALGRLWAAHGEATNGLLTREGPSFPRGLHGLLARDVVTVAVQDDVITGYVAYDRGRGYGRESGLSGVELITANRSASTALLRSLGSWSSVAGTVRWQGPTDELALLVPDCLPPTSSRRPYMLRVVDVEGAVRARGFAAAVRTQADFTLVDPEVPEHEGAWRLSVDGGRGSLQRVPPGPPRLDVRGLALLYAGAADTRALLRTGLLEAPSPGLDAFAGPAPQVRDYF